MNDEIIRKLTGVTGADNVSVNEDMALHSTFKAGGRAGIFVTPGSVKEAENVIRLLLTENMPFTVIGNGSNILVADSGYSGCIVCLGKGCDGVILRDGSITAEAGSMLSRIAYMAYENGLTGLEFASGIPGSLGGAVVMNAGAYGGEMKDVITEVTLFDTASGEEVILPGSEMRFGYRTSIVKEHPYIVISARMELEKADTEAIKARMDELSAARRSKQPLEYPSAGSTFKRPEGYFAGKLIEDAGLKGFSVGDAQVSEKHCGFVINREKAGAGDIIELIRTVRKRVFEHSGVMLEPEVVIIGDDIVL